MCPSFHTRIDSSPLSFLRRPYILSYWWPFVPSGSPSPNVWGLPSTLAVQVHVPLPWSRYWSQRGVPFVYVRFPLWPPCFFGFLFYHPRCPFSFRPLVSSPFVGRSLHSLSLIGLFFTSSQYCRVSSVVAPSPLIKFAPHETICIFPCTYPNSGFIRSILGFNNPLFSLNARSNCTPVILHTPPVPCSNSHMCSFSADTPPSHPLRFA